MHQFFSFCKRFNEILIVFFPMKVSRAGAPTALFFPGDVSRWYYFFARALRLFGIRPMPRPTKSIRKMVMTRERKSMTLRV
jgi:hypothetical protein